MKADPDDLRTLLIATRRGDETSARRLYAHVSPALVRCAELILRDEDLARDATQAVFLRVLSMPIRSLKKIDRPMPWLVTLVRNEARDTARSLERASRRERDASRPPAPARPVGGDGLRDAIARLPGDLAEVVILRHVGGMTFDDIGEALGTSRNTVASRHRRALDALRDDLAARGDTPTMEAADAR